MIVSNKHHFVFIKTRKVAGTSVEIALSAHCGPDDIITPITEKDEAIRGRLGYRGAQNHRGRIRDVRRRHLREMRRRRTIRPLIFYNHMPATEVISLVGWQVWREYLTFTVERNPWDKTLSHFYWATYRDPNVSFSQWLSGSVQRLSDFDLYSLGGRVAVDRVLRYERLAEDLDDLLQTLGVERTELPSAKIGYRPEATRDYRAQYSDADAELVAAAFQNEIETFGYTF